MTIVLVIDDDPLIAEIVQAAEPTWTVLAALDGLAGLDRIRQRIAAGQPLELVVLDITMPNLDGYDTCMQIRESDPMVPILPFTSLRTDILLPRYMRELRCAPVVYKGVSPTALSKYLRDAIGTASELPQRPQDAVFVRLQHKAAVAEDYARAQRTTLTRAVLFAPSLVDRLGLQSLIASAGGMAIVSTETGNDVISIARSAQAPQLLVAPACEALAARMLSQECSLPVLLIAPTLREGAAVVRLLREHQTAQPASGVIIADAHFPQLLSGALHALTRDHNDYLDPRLCEADAQRLIATVLAGRVFPEVSPRHAELIILDLLGLTNQEIAAHLAVDPATIRTYWKRVYAQLQLDRSGVQGWAQTRLRERPDLWNGVRQLQRLSGG